MGEGPPGLKRKPPTVPLPVPLPFRQPQYLLALLTPPTDDTASVPRLLAMDCGVLLLLVALANVRHSIVQDRTEPDCFQLLPFHAAGGDGESSSDGLL